MATNNGKSGDGFDIYTCSQKDLYWKVKGLLKFTCVDTDRSEKAACLMKGLCGQQVRDCIEQHGLPYCRANDTETQRCMEKYNEKYNPVKTEAEATLQHRKTAMLKSMTAASGPDVDTISVYNFNKQLRELNEGGCRKEFDKLQKAKLPPVQRDGNNVPADFVPAEEYRNCLLANLCSMPIKDCLKAGVNFEECAVGGPRATEDAKRCAQKVSSLLTERDQRDLQEQASLMEKKLKWVMTREGKDDYISRVVANPSKLQELQNITRDVCDQEITEYRQCINTASGLKYDRAQAIEACSSLSARMGQCVAMTHCSRTLRECMQKTSGHGLKCFLDKRMVDCMANIKSLGEKEL